ncbi:hypothetical protein PTB13_25985 [Bacillus sp. MHSD17]|nr:hypothetical protein [Bacillus sp. MHSD17]
MASRLGAFCTIYNLFNICAAGRSRRPSGLRKTNVRSNSLAHRTRWLRSDF